MSAISDLWNFLTTPDNWTGTTGIWTLTRAHLWISFVAVTIACAIAIPSAVVLAHRRIAPVASVAIVNVGRAMPSFAIIALVLPFSIRWGFGLGFWPTTVALVALGIPPIYTNTYAGVAGTPSDLVEAAEGVGMTGRQVLFKVEIPFALPLLLTGFRVSSVQIIATATLGALVGYRCLGTLVLDGLARPRTAGDRLIGGAFLVALLAVLVELALNRAEVRLLPWNRRVDGSRRRRRRADEPAPRPLDV